MILDDLLETLDREPRTVFLYRPTNVKVTISELYQGDDGKEKACMLVLREHNPGIFIEESVFDVDISDLEPVGEE